MYEEVMGLQNNELNWNCMVLGVLIRQIIIFMGCSKGTLVCFSKLFALSAVSEPPTHFWHVQDQSWIPERLNYPITP